MVGIKINLFFSKSKLLDENHVLAARSHGHVHLLGLQSVGDCDVCSSACACGCEASPSAQPQAVTVSVACAVAVGVAVE